MLKSFYTLLLAGCVAAAPVAARAGSHREAPGVAADPQADNTDLYVFKSPCDPNRIVIIANYIPFEHPAAGPNYYGFAENARYEIHIDNNGSTAGDEIVYRFTFRYTDQDSTTALAIRQGKQNRMGRYTCERSTNGGNSFVALTTDGVVPAPNIGPRSIEGANGLAAANYDSLISQAVTVTAGNERIFCGAADDPFFADLGGLFDLGDVRSSPAARDAMAKFNVHSIVLEIPVPLLQKAGKSVSQAVNILDPDFVIGVWASASRPAMVTQPSVPGAPPIYSGNYVQVSRVGMPLVNTLFTPLRQKDRWNGAASGSGDFPFLPAVKNPELGLYIDDSLYGPVFPGLSALRVPIRSLGKYDFRNQRRGLYSLRNTPGVVSTAFDNNSYASIFLPDSVSPRAADLLPFIYTGFPNLAPYHLSVGKQGNFLANGKPFVNNFLPTLADMIRLNMAVPATPRNSPAFSPGGLLQAAYLGLTDTQYNRNRNIQFIPNMDGFPNGRRLEDDVVSITLRIVAGEALAVIGLGYDDYHAGDSSVVTAKYRQVRGFSAGVPANDTAFKGCMPYVQAPWRAYNGASYEPVVSVDEVAAGLPLGLLKAYPNPFTGRVQLDYHLSASGCVGVEVTDIAGRIVWSRDLGVQAPGSYAVPVDLSQAAPGAYIVRLSLDGQPVAQARLLRVK